MPVYRDGTARSTQGTRTGQRSGLERRYGYMAGMEDRCTEDRASGSGHKGGGRFNTGPGIYSTAYVWRSEGCGWLRSTGSQSGAKWWREVWCGGRCGGKYSAQDSWGGRTAEGSYWMHRIGWGRGSELRIVGTNSPWTTVREPRGTGYMATVGTTWGNELQRAVDSCKGQRTQQ